MSAQDAETRDVLNPEGVKIGEMTLPSGTSEAEWALKLAVYSTPNVEQTPLQQQTNLILTMVGIGQLIISSYYAQFRLEGKTIQEIVDASTKLDSFEKLLLFGLFYEALYKLETIETDSVITQEWKDAVTAQVQPYAV